MRRRFMFPGVATEVMPDRAQAALRRGKDYLGAI
jgi:hypothetical protein